MWGEGEIQSIKPSPKNVLIWGYRSCIGINNLFHTFNTEIIVLLLSQICRWTPYNDNKDNYWSIGSEVPTCSMINNSLKLVYRASGKYMYVIYNAILYARRR